MGILTVDVGNTITRYGVFEGDVLTAAWDVATRESLTADEARLVLRGFLGPEPLVGASAQAALSSASLESPTKTLKQGTKSGLTTLGPPPLDAIVSCVVPGLVGVHDIALTAEFGRRPLVVGPGLKTGLRMRYNDPAELGPDRVADMVAARADYRAPLAIVDLGTATNIMLLDAEGSFVGGLIAPGLALSTKALSQAAARLPAVGLVAPASVIGKTTREAMQAGIVLGEAARIDGLLDRAFAELGEVGSVILTGTDADMIAQLLSHEALVDDRLTLRGLNLLYHLNRKAS